MADEKQNKEPKFTNGIFVGRLKTGEGQTKQEPPVPFKKYTLTFKPDENSQKTFTMTEFIKPNESGQFVSPYNLVEDKWYNIKYYETPGTFQGKAIMYKNLAGITEGKGAVTPREQGQNSTQAPAGFRIDMKPFDQFAADYVENAKSNPDLKFASRMVGTYLLTYNQNDELYQLFVKCCKALGIEIPKKA